MNLHNKRKTARLPAATRSVIIAALLAGLHSLAVRAEADGPDHWRVVGVAATDALFIRSQPGAHSTKLGEIPPGGRCIRNLGCKGGLTYQEFSTLSKQEQAKRKKQNPRWCKIEYQGIKGWVAGRYLAEGGCP